MVASFGVWGFSGQTHLDMVVRLAHDIGVTLWALGFTLYIAGRY